MSSATISSKGQITIPSSVRKALEIDSGDRVEFVEVDPGRFELIAATRSIRELKDLFGKPERSISIEEMNRAIAAKGAKAADR